MRAVNLIPPDSKRSGARAKASAPRGPAVALIAGLVIALVFVTIYVLTTNTIKDRRAQIATVQSQTAVLQAQAKGLTDYASFVKLAADREATVRQIATQRFDWHAALSDLSKVVPPNTSLQSLLGTVAPGVTVQGAGGSGGASAISTGTLRGTIPAPAFEMRGCTSSQDDVARLMSRLRLINGVTRVTLADSTKQDASAVGTVTGSSTSGSCGANTPSFDLVVFFKPLPGAASATTTTGAPAPTTTTTSTTSTSTSTSTAQASTTPSSSSQPVTSTSGGSK